MGKGKNTDQTVKSRASMIIDGLIEPEPNERYLLNLRKRKTFDQWDKEEHHKIAVMGGKAVQELHGERKTARQSLENILDLKITDEIVNKADIDPSIVDRLRRSNPNATLYDLIHAVAVGRALDGSVSAMAYVRDTHGDKPTDHIEVTENITTDRDRELMESISRRLENGDHVEIVRDITSDNVKTDHDAT